VSDTATQVATYIQSRREEVWNAVTHGLGAALALTGGAWLVLHAVAQGDVWQLASLSVYAATLVLVFVASTLYHSLAHTRAKPVFHLLDHMSIFLFIAGTSTPLTLVGMRAAGGTELAIGVWSLAGLGLLFKAIFRTRFQPLSTALYVAMPAVRGVAAGSSWHCIAPAGMAWLLAGGASYILGVVFFWWTSLRFHHTIWHLFVLAGSACHFTAISLYIIK
jgi:hemolysin III